MAEPHKKIHYLAATLFWFAGIIFLVIGLWNLFDALNAGLQVTSSVVALFFLALFAMVAMVYGRFIFQNIRTDQGTAPCPGPLARLRPATVIGFLVYGFVPLLFIYLSADSREFSQERQAAFGQIRPAVIQYIAEHGKAPGELSQLVPGYLPQLPTAIVSAKTAGPARRIQYVTTGKNAVFYYKTAGITGSETCYDIINDRDCHKK